MQKFIVKSVSMKTFKKVSTLLPSWPIFKKSSIGQKCSALIMAKLLVLLGTTWRWGTLCKILSCNLLFKWICFLLERYSWFTWIYLMYLLSMQLIWSTKLQWDFLMPTSLVYFQKYHSFLYSWLCIFWDQFQRGSLVIWFMNKLWPTIVWTSSMKYPKPLQYKSIQKSQLLFHLWRPATNLTLAGIV